MDGTAPHDTALHARVIRPRAGRWRRLLVNLLLRVLVKWAAGLHLDIHRLRRQQIAFDRQAARQTLPVQVQPSEPGCPRAQWLVPKRHDAKRVLLYLHGGAFVARSPAAHAAMVAPWCVQLGARALMVDYRLAPEQPYPAAADDCFGAYAWLLEQGYTAREVVIAGDSAGGNLALATLHRIRDAGLPQPACAVLLSPFVDFTLSGASLVGNARRDPLFTLPFALSIRACYAPPERFLDPAVSPLFGEFGGLPPLLFQVGSTEMLADDATRAAQRAKDAGVPVTLEIWEHMPHVFQALSMLPQAREAAEHVMDFINVHTRWHVDVRG